MNSNITIPLPTLLNRTDNVINIMFSVIHAEIPNSFYLVNNTNNTIIINSITYTVQNGNYNANTLITALLAVIPSGFSISFNPVIVKFTFSYTSNFTISQYSTINPIIGGDSSTLMSSSSNILTLPYVVNCLPTPRINFRSKQLCFSNYNQYDNTTDIIISVQNNSCLGGAVTYNNYSGLKFIYEKHLSELKSINLRLTDDMNNELDLNNQNFYITVQFDVNYIPSDEKLSLENIIRGVKI